MAIRPSRTVGHSPKVAGAAFPDAKRLVVGYQSLKHVERVRCF